MLNNDLISTIAASGQKWLVGVSGGGDSVAMLHLLCEAGLKDQLIVANFNHNWSSFGTESSAFTRKLAKELGMEFRTATGEGKSATNAEESARTQRYGWMRSLCEAEHLGGIILAHTQNDIAESFLMRAGKGSGLSGLAGMRPFGSYQGVHLLRPLLATSREELRTYLQTCHQTWLEDPDNTSGGSQRARVRALLPQLEAVGIRMEGLAASVAALAQAEDVLQGATQAIPLQPVTGGITVARPLLTSAQPELAVRALARTILLAVKTASSSVMVRRGKRMALWNRIRTESAGTATLHGAKFVWNADKVTVTPEK